MATRYITPAEFATTLYRLYSACAAVYGTKDRPTERQQQCYIMVYSERVLPNTSLLGARLSTSLAIPDELGFPQGAAKHLWLSADRNNDNHWNVVEFYEAYHRTSEEAGRINRTQTSQAV